MIRDQLAKAVVCLTVRVGKELFDFRKQDIASIVALFTCVMAKSRDRNPPCNTAKEGWETFWIGGRYGIPYGKECIVDAFFDVSAVREDSPCNIGAERRISLFKFAKPALVTLKKTALY